MAITTLPVINIGRSPSQSSDVADVGVGNFIAMESYLQSEQFAVGGIDFSTALTRLWAALPTGWTREHVFDAKWVPLSVYAAVELQLARLVGDPARLVEAAQYGAVRSKYGGKFAISDRFTLGLYAISPQMFHAQVVPRATGMFNINKRTEVLQSSPTSVTYRLTYVQESTGVRLRSPREDHRSLQWWAPGFTSAPSKERGEFSHITRVLVELDLPWLFEDNREFIADSCHYEIIGDELCLNGQVVAQRISLFLDDSGYFTARENIGRPSRPAWEVIKDVIVTAPDGHAWVVAYQGELYCPEAGCSIFRYTWNRIGKIFSWRLFTILLHMISKKRAQKGEQEILERLDVALAQEIAALERLGLQSSEAGLYPDARFMKAAADGRLEGIAIERPVVLVFDIRGWTRTSRAMGSEQVAARIMQPFMNRVNQAIAAYRPNVWDTNPPYGVPIAYLFNHTGDGVAIVFYNAEEGSLVNLSLTVAQQLHAAIGELMDHESRPMVGRCGIASGDQVVMYEVGTAQGSRRLCFNGNAINLAARCEAAGKLPDMAAPETFPTTLMPTALADLEIVSQHAAFVNVGATDLPGVGLVRLSRVVDPRE
ncbi:MAG: hypothetical protein HYV33_03395 [Candidatus Kerfeldbacteria bacterium]|nr:hypothetical protein [Candidatus Kerfeldbacteria bacterium]